MFIIQVIAFITLFCVMQSIVNSSGTNTPEVTIKPVKPQSVGCAAINYGSMTIRELREVCKGNPKYQGYSRYCHSRKELAAFVNMTDMIGRGIDELIAFECRYDF